MSKMVQCRFCGRVRVGSEWTWDAEVKVDVTGFCATCGRLQKDKAEKRRAAEGRAIQRRRARGYGPPADGEDVFAGLREEEVDE